MSPSDSEEKTLVTARIHWGIFLIPIGAVATLLLTMLIPYFLLFRPLLSFARFGGGSIPLFVTALFPLIFAVLPGLVLLWLAWVAFASTEYLLTNRRLRFRSGWLCRNSGEISLLQVEAVFTQEDLVGRLLGFGTVVLTGIGGSVFPLYFVPRHRQFHARLLEATEAAKSGKRLVPEPSLREAWEALNRPLPSTEDDSRYMPKG
jgi:uncharacterized membrane protein YdbT with pleckstrin-like domain